MGWLDRLLGRETAPTALARFDGDGPALPATSTTTSADTRPGAWGPLGYVAARFDSLVNYLSGLGGSSDKGRAALPDVTWGGLAPGYLLSLWRFNGYARRIVNVIPDDACKKGWRIDVGEAADAEDGADDDAGEAAHVLADEDSRLKITARVHEAWVSARRDGGAHLLMVLDEQLPTWARARPQAWLAQPVDPARVRAVRNLVVIERLEATPAKWDEDPTSARFRQPLSWNVSASGGSGLAGVEVHWSRMLYFGGAKLPPRLRQQNNGYDDSILQSVWDQVRDKSSIGQASATMAQQLTFTLMKLGGYDQQAMGDQAELLAVKLQTIAKSLSIMNMAVVDGEDDIQTKSTPVTGVGELNEIASEALCAVTGFPRAKLMGEAPGGLNADGESQIENWGDVVSACQEFDLREPLTQLYGLLYAAKDGPAKGRVPERWRIEFEPLRRLGEKEQADLEKVHAETDQIRIDSGVVTAEHVARSRFGKGGYRNDLLPVEVADAEATTAKGMAEAQAELDRAAAAAATKAGDTTPTTPAAPAGIVPADQQAAAVNKGLNGIQSQQSDVYVAQVTRGEKTPELAALQIQQLGVAPDEAARMVALAQRQPKPKPAPDPTAGDPAAAPRGDAAEDSVVLLSPLPADVIPQWAAARAAVETLLGQALEVEDDPHVTVLYVGKLPAEAVAAVADAVGPALVDFCAEPVCARGVGFFDPADAAADDEEGGGLARPTPIVLPLVAWQLERANMDALRAAAHLVTAPQYPEYRPHLTLGYLPRLLTEEEKAALVEIDAAVGQFDWTPSRIELRRGAEVVSTFAARRDGAARRDTAAKEEAE